MITDLKNKLTEVQKIMDELDIINITVYQDRVHIHIYQWNRDVLPEFEVVPFESKNNDYPYKVQRTEDGFEFLSLVRKEDVSLALDKDRFS